MIAVTGTVHGRVQGVGFRWSAVQEAEGLGVTGWVRNLPSGQVEFWAEGPAADVESFLDWCRQGPRFATVDEVQTRAARPEGMQDFRVR
ncbi:acylphosphatase [Luteococcus sp. Sow4_B9]|uniref:acylphosphatase n=1 Tax=Luteococcus sp. Sow4_B9 TaxID=3438792 RepID=UPI003F9EA98B